MELAKENAEKEAAERVRKLQEEAAQRENLFQKEREEAAQRERRLQEEKEEAAQRENLLKEEREKGAERERRLQEEKGNSFVSKIPKSIHLSSAITKKTIPS